MLSKFEVKMKMGDQVIDLTSSKSQAARAMYACLLYLEKEATRHQLSEVAHFVGVAADAAVDAVIRLEDRKNETGTGSDDKQNAAGEKSDEKTSGPVN